MTAYEQRKIQQLETENAKLETKIAFLHEVIEEIAKKAERFCRGGCKYTKA